MFKILLVGDEDTGKSALLVRYVVKYSQDERFIESYFPTIGVDFVRQNQRFRIIDFESKVFKLQFWDNAGQERFRKITSSNYRGANGVIVVYDVTNRESFNHVGMWIDEIKKKTTSEVSILLVGNKNDLGNSIVVSYDEGKELADRLGVKFFETSAKNSFNIEEAFTAIVSDIISILKEKS